MKFLFCKILIFFSFCLLAQTIPIERITPWTKAGSQNNTLEVEVSLDFVNEGADPTVLLPNDEILNQLITIHEGKNIEVYFPVGSYKFTNPVSLPSNFRLIGAGADSTFLQFNPEANVNLINVRGALGAEVFDITENVQIGDTAIYLNLIKPLSVGEWLILTQDDSALITSDWAKRSAGQIVQVKKIEGNKITLNAVIRIELNLANNISASKLIPKENVFIEKISIEREDETVNQTSNIFFSSAVNCKVECIASKFCNFGHITLEKSSQIEIAGSYFNDAFGFGGGGKAYGVVLQFTSGDCLIYNNVFEKLRHAILLQAGANGNVISYNYSIEPFWSDTALPANSAGDLVLHGNYPSFNLFEGNVCQQIVIDNSHGINGPRNTFFRNRTELYGIFMNTSPASDGQNFVGNEITNDGFLLGNYALQGTDHFEHGNNQRGNIIPLGTDELPDFSLYLVETPTFYIENNSWPPIGPQNEIGAYENEAQFRYNSSALTACSEIKEPNVVSNLKSENIVAYPNPTNKLLHFKEQIEAKNWIITNSVGLIVMKGERLPINVSKLDLGLYYIIIEDKESQFFKSHFFKL